MSDIKTIPAETKQAKLVFEIPPGASVSDVSFVPDFSRVKPYLSSKPLQRPNRITPNKVLTNDELRRIASQNPPPPEWYEGDEECPFL